MPQGARGNQDMKGGERPNGFSCLVCTRVGTLGGWVIRLNTEEFYRSCFGGTGPQHE